jgi:hypothetical protein
MVPLDVNTLQRIQSCSIRFRPEQGSNVKLNTNEFDTKVVDEAAYAANDLYKKEDLAPKSLQSRPARLQELSSETQLE